MNPTFISIQRCSHFLGEWNTMSHYLEFKGRELFGHLPFNIIPPYMFGFSIFSFFKFMIIIFKYFLHDLEDFLYNVLNIISVHVMTWVQICIDIYCLYFTMMYIFIKLYSGLWAWTKYQYFVTGCVHTCISKY